MSSELRARVGRRIRLLRRRREWDQIDLAVHSGVSKTHISDVERGKKELCLDTLGKLAKALGVEPGELLR